MAPTKPSETTNATSSSSRKSLPELAKDKLQSGNASQLGDPISLKAETADSEPTENDRGAKGSAPARKSNDVGSNTGGDVGNHEVKEPKTEEKKGGGGQNANKGNTLKEAAMKNPSTLGDPVSLKAEKSDSEPTENDRGALKGKGKPKGSKL